MSFTETVKSTAPAFTLILSGLLLGKIDYQIDQIEKKILHTYTVTILKFFRRKDLIHDEAIYITRLFNSF